MTRKSLLDGKKTLVVDDDPDVLETLVDLLPMCEVTKAFSFDEAKKLLESQSFDMVILDIMGVQGYALLDIAIEKKVPAIMLTAQALSIEDTVKSFKKGAASFVPKEKMADITTYLNDILEAQEKGKSPWWHWLKRFSAYYDKRFGPDWQKGDRDFWKKPEFWV